MALWVIGLTETDTKDFRVLLTKNRDEEILKKFITKLIPWGNYLVTGDWSGYNWADGPNSGYIRLRHIHWRRDFGRCVESTSHMESIWSQ